MYSLGRIVAAYAREEWADRVSSKEGEMLEYASDGWKLMENRSGVVADKEGETALCVFWEFLEVDLSKWIVRVVDKSDGQQL